MTLNIFYPTAQFCLQIVLVKEVAKYNFPSHCFQKAWMDATKQISETQQTTNPLQPYNS
jgi:hypothetical protein